MAALHALRIHQFFYPCGLLPLVFRGLITTHVDVFRGEHRTQFGEDIIYKLEDLLGGSKRIGMHSPAGLHFRGVSRHVTVAQVWIGGYGSRHMPGHVNFRDDGDMTRSGIGDKFPKLVLSVESSVAHTIIRVAIPVWRAGITECSDFGKLGIFLDLDAPSLIVR